MKRTFGIQIVRANVYDATTKTITEKTYRLFRREQKLSTLGALETATKDKVLEILSVTQEDLEVEITLKDYLQAAGYKVVGEKNLAEIMQEECKEEEILKED